jgi:hypothetical protein
MCRAAVTRAPRQAKNVSITAMKFPGSTGDKPAIKGQKSGSTQFGLSFARNALVEWRPCWHRVVQRPFSLPQQDFFC